MSTTSLPEPHRKSSAMSRSGNTSYGDDQLTMDAALGVPPPPVANAFVEGRPTGNRRLDAGRSARKTLTLTMTESAEDPEGLPNEVAVKRSDSVYNAHAYLTKVPVTAIEPFIRALTKPGDVVLDIYAGSGMTGVAAAMQGRRAEMRDISALGAHIGRNYLNLVDADRFRSAADDVVAKSLSHLGDVYATRCSSCDQPSTLSRTVWSYVYECRHCRGDVNYYEVYKSTGWRKASMKCPTCARPFVTRGSRRLREEPVFDTVSCPCSKSLRDQPHTEPLHRASLEEVSYPDVAIGADRQMFQASALSRHGLLTTSAFFSVRNLAVLGTLHEQIMSISDESIRSKLLFTFTAVLSRASKRYQWHPKRPLNAANQNYYIAPVFFEWNVYDLFRRKSEAVIRSDEYIRDAMAANGVTSLPAVNYRVGSSATLDLGTGSVDYVFTDPPFGSNIFYSDMNLFQEAWLGSLTDHEEEAVVDRSGNGSTRRTADRYERLITDSLREAHRVLRDEGWLSLVFSNSSGSMWALVQRAIHNAGFELENVAILNKGQRSVKGLASGFENVVTVDLILSMRKAVAERESVVEPAPEDALSIAITNVLTEDAAPTPSHVYLGVIRQYLGMHWDVADLDIEGIGLVLQSLGFDVDPASGRLRQTEDIA